MLAQQPLPAASPSFQRVGLLYHPKLTESRVMAAEMLEFIESLNSTAWVESSWNEVAIVERLDETDLLIVFGGDGSMLRGARLTAARKIPIFGVHMGRLGFLVEVQPAEWPDRVYQAMFGHCWIEERMMVQAEHRRGEKSLGIYEALNEIVVSRGRLARVVRLSTYIDDGFLTTYTADGLIVATSTGSTAYALAAGGPILPPELENFLIIPIAPHLSLERAIILSRGATMRVTVVTDHTASLTVDGQFEIEVENGDEVIVSASPSVARFVRLQARNYFYRTLVQSLGWPHNKEP